MSGNYSLTLYYFMLDQIIKNQWRLWWRERQIVWLFATLTILSVLALCFQINDIGEKVLQRARAQASSRKAWMEQGEKHPHVAAHFGNYAYKKPSVLTIFDPGITEYTGTSVYLEPHRQNDFLLNESGEKDTGARFGAFTPSFICRFIVPLLIILLTFNLIVSEKSSGTFALLLSQGSSAREVIVGKIAATMLLFTAFITVYLLLTVIAGAIAVSSEVPVTAFLYLWCCYLTYYMIWCCIGVTVSSVVNHSGVSISILLLFWILSNLILPKWAASAAENAYPLVTNYAFKKKISEDIANGLNGHDVASERAKRIRDSVLKAENVDSVQQLAFNFEGYVMQRGEEYSSKVYDIHFQSMYKTLENQSRLQTLFAWLSPPMLLRNLSMAASNASLETEIRFQQDAEKYRRNFVEAMNKDMMMNSKWGNESWERYKVKNSLYSTIPDFTAPVQPLRWRLGFVSTERTALLLWLVLAFGTMLFISGKKSLK